MKKLNVIAMFAVIIFVTAFVLVARGKQAAGQDDDKKAVENVVRGFEKAVQEFDFDKADSFTTPDARWVENSYPQPVEPGLRSRFLRIKDSRIRMDYHPRDVEVNIRGDVAWATVTLDSTWVAEGRAEWRTIYVESMILVRTPDGWKITFGHTTRLPADFGASAELGQWSGGVKFASVQDGSPAAKTGFKAGDVMIEFDGQKIDTPLDFIKFLRWPNIGDKVMVTVMRGQEKITKEVTMEGR